jgi:ribosomal protein L37AE/L43A
MIEFSEILRKFGREYLEKYKDKIPQNHLKAINDILICRRRENGGQVYFCKHCHRLIYSYHSCGNRNCNKCQNELADKWFDKSKERLLNVNHFLVTFTLFGLLRPYARSNQKLFYNILFKSASDALQEIAYDTKFAGGKLGMIAVLHSWARNLSFHPHIHFVVTGGGFFEDENIWLPSKDDFLVPVKALSKIFKAKFRDLLKNENEKIFRQIPYNFWKNDWVVHSEPVGSGEQALSYLARYIFRPAISNNNILSLGNGIVKFKFKNAKTKQWKEMELPVLKFIHRYLQHVLPKGFIKVRYYGLYAHAYKKRFKGLPVQRLVNSSKKKSIENKNDKSHLCSKCHNPLILIEEFEKTHFYSNGPPKRKVLLEAIYKKLQSIS